MKETDCESTFKIIAQNFQILIDNAERILSSPSMLNGKYNNLSAEFAFGDIISFPISSLLKAWKDGYWKTNCPNHDHESFILSGAAFMSDGIIKEYCPHCDEQFTRSETFLKDYAYMTKQTHGDGTGLSLSEIVEVLRASGG